MRTNRTFVAIPAALLSVGLVAGCGGSSKTASSATDSAKNAGSSASASAGAAAGSATNSASGDSSASDTSCPTDNTRKFAKTRFATDLGLAAGTFHRYIYKPYKNGDFTKGHINKMAAVKAAGVAAIDYKLLSNAQKNAKANPTLCKKVAQPISDAMTKLKSVDKKQLLTGDIAGLAGAESSLSKVLSGSKESGNAITNDDNLDKAKSAISSN